MEETVQKLLVSRKGLLAADESTKTITKRFAALGLTSTPELNKKYREMLFTTPGVENYISGVILFDESVRQDLHKILESKRIIPGIKVDEGLMSFNDTPEQVTEGLETLDVRLKEYAQMGMKFAKWRGVFKITDMYPSKVFYDENLGRMAKYAKITQENGIVPIVEPEVLLEGNHTTTRCGETMDATLKILFEKLNTEGVDLKNLIVKTSMALPGPDSGVKALPLEVANATLRALNRSVPPEVPGIVFLSGGQTSDEATNNLNEIVKLKENSPWVLTFSFSRALQNEAMETWAGKDENTANAQQVFIKRLEMVSKAAKGEL
ncbi:MAG: Fructose-bisphosphate aldolase [Microgenomates group bacterium GW2011_GWC1_39_7b]|uniref:fructose-bisphosphate aldolase n=3 Tax=Candidatus Woeseibacteriota TaxID=1752722 RepID=A0A0G0UU46_9BACT|nr:MAG: Fructose-bisphosphate aldolase [Candidatus Woesebacteria bacterium GW2011_GWB1_39_10]KKR26463.1 MAG: Fructose-bisphosphate aldolase [Microgenomates group bacterium GW2011_GWC1_39_7b]KKR73984.1 MAG: Fructose-bisphosphate aldolase [Candidatus Woesebacteria bacterium GW2011_GWA2_40_7]KKR92228.1 MAG: Fructose-bisphosphate aldolase [Candidatus Woesebacteria bacterium GW2011_GWA1_41_13b]